jgi:hypothetical protein
MRDYVKQRFDNWIGADGCDTSYKGSDPDWMEEENPWHYGYWRNYQDFKVGQGQESGGTPIDALPPKTLLSNQDEKIPDVLVNQDE